MNASERLFIWVLIINAVIAILYLLWGVFFHRKEEERGNRRIAYVIRSVVMLLCPVIGILFFLLGALWRLLFFHIQVDLEDVVFSKERASSIVKADIEREKNIVPIREALAVTDKPRLRELMLNVIKGDVSNSLGSIAVALDSTDSETSHYAASILSKSLNEFRMTVRKIDKEIRQDNEERMDYCKLQLAYMNPVLAQRVFTEVEQKYFVNMMADTGQMLYDGDKIRMEPAEYAEIALRLSEIGEFDRSLVWCRRGVEDFPESLDIYKSYLQLLYTMGDRKSFREVLDRLMQSGISIDNDTLEMIRVLG